MTSGGEEDPRVGADIGGFRVQAFVADGAMGRVYEAGRIEDGLHSAIKVLHSKVAKDEVAVERFRREYETANELEHPYIVKVLDFGETQDGSWYLAMEFLEGEELGQRLRQGGSLSLPNVVRIVGQLADALDHAHSFGVIHRDLKPDNVFLCHTDEGEVIRVLDFGAVKLQMDVGPKLTAFGTTIGSPYYMSPEQAMGKQDVDQRTDVFAVGAILFEMLTGKVAFDGQNVAQVLMKIVHEPPPVLSFVAPHYPPALDSVIERGCAKDKDQRFASVGALADAFYQAIGLTGDRAKWVTATEAELTEALSNVSAPAAQPAPAVRAAAGPAAVPIVAPNFGTPAGTGTGASGPSIPPPGVPTSSGPLVLLGVGLLCVVIASAAAIAFLLL